MTDASAMPCMAIIPCLNEAAHIEALVERLMPSAGRLDMRIVVVDGGSSDGTTEIVARIAAQNPRVTLLFNPKRLQSAAINLAVAQYGDGCASFIRIDAHGDYPVDYCDLLVAEAEATGADSVVVAMATRGFGTFQKATAVAQNSRLGNGGSPHRKGAGGRWVEHGHHALMQVAAFRAVGGYDENFSHNEDAELDHRLRVAGYRLWMTGRTYMIYYPRATPPALFRQYLNYGRGRAKNILKHRTMPKLRQALPLAVMPLVAGSLLAVLNWTALLPAGMWMAACLGYGIWMAVMQRNPYGPLAAVSAMVMHLGWSSGFWLHLFDFRKREAETP